MGNSVGIGLGEALKGFGNTWLSLLSEQKKYDWLKEQQQNQFGQQMALLEKEYELKAKLPRGDGMNSLLKSILLASPELYKQAKGTESVNVDISKVSPDVISQGKQAVFDTIIGSNPHLTELLQEGAYKVGDETFFPKLESLYSGLKSKYTEAPEKIWGIKPFFKTENLVSTPLVGKFFKKPSFKEDFAPTSYELSPAKEGSPMAKKLLDLVNLSPKEEEEEEYVWDSAKGGLVRVK